MDRPSYISYFKRIGVFLLLVFALLEAGLRLEGFVKERVQYYRNQRAVSQTEVYRILCLGESTTQGQYPRFLEEELNRRNIGVRFAVIDEGRAYTTTPSIISRLESQLDEYRPDMVVVMMGINDWGRVILPRPDPLAKIADFLKSMRIYNLARLVAFYFREKLNGAGVQKLWERYRGVQGARTLLNCIHQGYAFAAPVETEETLKRTIEAEPLNEGAHISLGWVYLNEGKTGLAEESFKKALSINPQSDSALGGLGSVYRQDGRYDLAEEALHRALALNDRNYSLYVTLGLVCQEQKQYLRAEEAFRQAVSI
ncbi:MAG: tetratricopeptide repeat protein, partial [Candidatus Omnitrophota bacterium]